MCTWAQIFMSLAHFILRQVRFLFHTFYFTIYSQKPRQSSPSWVSAHKKKKKFLLVSHSSHFASVYKKEVEFLSDTVPLWCMFTKESRVLVWYSSHFDACLQKKKRSSSYPIQFPLRRMLTKKVEFLSDTVPTLPFVYKKKSSSCLIQFILCRLFTKSQLF